ncbi:hypothetical protein [Stenotrophomonas sp. SY1]|uniref:hypothetical protein n=1 Tax=Stenotrophomonas sp. SY1 TaxID=477235 RepID=UPI001E400EA2|nr:hypothetical protein [Stenotrophomonas sp. SY1]MCD9087079.1 hypothetical protein [Stenotrophomonas sp. SY1]
MEKSSNAKREVDLLIAVVRCKPDVDDIQPLLARSVHADVSVGGYRLNWQAGDMPTTATA